MLPFVLVGAAVLVVVLILLNLAPAEKKIEGAIDVGYPVGSEQFVRSMGHVLGPPMAEGNATAELLNGDAIFPAMLGAIAGAERSVCFESYIYWKGETGHAFSKALAERAQAGVSCHVILDWVGSGNIDDGDLKAMEAAGVEVERYHPLKWYHLARLNNRTHRKLLVVDGCVGFTGGVGIADEWRGDGQTPDHWRDTQYRVTGPVVAQMQAAFLDNWMKTRQALLDGPDYFPPLNPTGDQCAQVFASSPQQGNESVRLMYMISMGAARGSILLSNAYFMPDDACLEMLERAVARGVRVEIILPGKRIDAPMTRWAARGLYGRLLKAGVGLWEYAPAMYHCKVMIVDGLWVSVGSTNFDNRSFLLNEEANLNVLCPRFAARQTEVFEDDKRRSKPISLEAWQNRPLWERLASAATVPFRSQL